MALFFKLRNLAKQFSRIFSVLIMGGIIYFSYLYITESPLPTPLQNIFQSNTTNVTTTNFVKATILNVVDGDTVIVVASKDELKVRMIGINTPESVHSDISKNTPEGIIASNYTKNALKEGMTIYLEYDVNDTDQYGRTLAYIWLSNNVDTSSFEDFCKYNYGAILLQNTYCEAKYYAPNDKYKDWYELLDKEN